MKYDLTEFKNVNEFELVEEGKYEVTIEKITETKHPNTNRERLSLMLRIRNDVNQKFQNRVLFYDIHKEENGIYYNRNSIAKILLALEVNNYIYDSLDDLVSTMYRGNLVVKVVIKFNEYRNQKENSIPFFEKTNVTVEYIGSDNDDLPF